MIGRYAFISPGEAGAYFPWEYTLALCSEKQFSKLIRTIKFDWDEFNAGVFVKYCMALERLIELSEYGLKVNSPDTVWMALENYNYEIGQYLLERCNIFQSPWKPELAELAKCIENLDNLSVFLQLAEEFGALDQWGEIDNIDWLWHNYSCRTGEHLKPVGRLMYELTALLASGALWRPDLKALAEGRKHLRHALEIQEQSAFGRYDIDVWLHTGLLFEDVFEDISEYCSDSQLAAFVKITMIIDLMVWNKFPELSAMSLHGNITRLMQLSDEEFLKLIGWEKYNLRRCNRLTFASEKSCWPKLYDYMTGS